MRKSLPIPYFIQQATRGQWFHDYTIVEALMGYFAANKVDACATDFTDCMSHHDTTPELQMRSVNQWLKRNRLPFRAVALRELEEAFEWQFEQVESVEQSEETRPHHIALHGMRNFKKYLSDAIKTLDGPMCLIDSEYQDEIHDDYNLWAEDPVPAVAYQVIQLLLKSNEPAITDLSAWVSAALEQVQPRFMDTEAVVEFIAGSI